MKTIHKPYAFLIAGLLILTGCDNHFEPPVIIEKPLNPIELAEDEGTFSLEIDGVQIGRTILPTTVQNDFALYTFVFSSSDRDDVSVDRTNSTRANSITLSATTWDLTVTAYMDSGKTRPAAQGSLTGIVINAGANTSGNLELKAIIEEDASGTFSWNVGYPTETTTASMTITPLDTQTGTQEQTLYFIGGTPLVNKNNSSSPLSLKTGYYRVEFILSNGKHSVGREEYLHIYKNMVSQFTYTFTQDHFTFYSVTSGEDSGPGSLRHAIINAASNSTILIESGVETIALTSRLEINKNLTIAGNGVTITRAASWTATSTSSQLLYISGSSTTVNVSRVHFKDGRATNYGAAIYHYQGSLTLESCIFSGNQTSASSAYSGAIYNSGTMTIRGCTFISNSSAPTNSGYGGAVYIASGSLTLTGNLFYGNTAYNSRGPIVYRSSGTVTSSGYNVVDVALGTGTAQSGWTAGTGDKEIKYLPISTDTFQPYIGDVELKVISTRPVAYPTVDFYGNSITNGAAAGAVQSTIADPRPALTGTVNITGTAAVGQTLTANTGSLGGTGTVFYQWQRGDTTTGPWTNIDDANSSTYSIVGTDGGSTITITVTRPEYSGSVMSSPTAAVTVAAGIVISLTEINEWELTEQIAQAIATIDKIISVTGTYTTYRWYLDGIQVGTSANYTFNKSAGVYQLVVVVTNSAGESRSGRCRITVSASPPSLTADVWVNGNITDASGEDWYLFPVTIGTTYRVWWNDRKQGVNDKSGDIVVGARYQNATTFIFGGTDTTVDSGWNTAQSFTANQTGTVFVRVIPYGRSNSDNGTYDIVYSTSSTRPTYPITVTFNTNSGSGTTPTVQTINAGSSITLPGGSGLSRSGYTFGGWNTNSSGTGTNYSAGSSYTPTDNITLYARWYINNRNITVVMRDSYGDGWNNASLRISVNGSYLSTNPTISSSQGYTNTYSFNANGGAMVAIYWNKGSYDTECAFAVYYTDNPPSPAFNPASGATNNTARLLVHRLYGSLASTSTGALLGSFTVTNP